MASSTSSVLASFAFAALAWTGVGYMVLKSYFPGRGIGVIRNVFKKTVGFQEAVHALKAGKRIRRKRERRGFTKLLITKGKDKSEEYATYYADRKNDPELSVQGSFSIEDVLATDWLIEE